MRLNKRVNIIAANGYHVRAVHIEQAEEMIALGVIVRLNDRTCELTGKHMPSSLNPPHRIHHGIKRAPDSQAGNSGRTWGYGGERLSARIFGRP